MSLIVEILAIFVLLFPGRALAEPSRTASLLVEAETGRILFSENATEKRYPASLTKMMTLYLVLDALEKAKSKWISC